MGMAEVIHALAKEGLGLSSGYGIITKSPLKHTHPAVLVSLVDPQGLPKQNADG